MAIGAASLDWPDYLSLVGYFVAVVGFGIWVINEYIIII